MKQLTEDTAKPPISELRQYRLAVILFFVVQGLVFASWASRIPQIQQAHQLSDGAWGSVLFSLPAGLLVGLPLAGWATVRFGSRWTILLAAMVHICLLPCIALAAQVWQLVVVLFFFGLSGNLLNISVNTQAVGVEALYGRSIMAALHGMWSLSAFAGAAIGALMISQEIIPLYHFSLMALPLLLLAFYSQNKLLSDAETSTEKKKLFVMPDRPLLKLGLVALCGMICEGTMFDWSGIYFSKVVQPPEDLLALGYVAFMGAMAGARFIGDKVAFQLGNRRTIQINGLLIATGLLIAVIFPQMLSVIIGFILVGFGVSTVVPLVYGMSAKSQTMPAGMAITAVSSIGFMGFLFGPPLIGYISELSNLRWSFGLVALLGLGVTLLIRQVEMSK
jgi:MFS family permease